MFNRLVRGGGGGDGHEFFVVQNEKRRTIGGNGLAFAPLPKFAQNGQRAAVQRVAALDAPDGIHV